MSNCDTMDNETNNNSYNELINTEQCFTRLEVT